MGKFDFTCRKSKNAIDLDGLNSRKTTSDFAKSAEIYDAKTK